MDKIFHPDTVVSGRIWRGSTSYSGGRIVPEETPVAFSYNRATYAVMLATPDDLHDFAVGFSLSEGIIRHPAEIEALEVIRVPQGIDLRMDLPNERLTALTLRQRRLAGPSGCGLCGLQSLDMALPPIPRVVSDVHFAPTVIQAALSAMRPAQRLNQRTRAVHAAAFWAEERGLCALREDVGRHNALDKLAGALAGAGVATDTGFILLTSRVSVEMVQKVATIGAPMIVAVSAPTALAVRVADQAGITLIGIARDDGFEVFTHPHRVL